MKVLIVGAGLFGSTIARGLQMNGHQVTVFDDNREMSATAPSGLLMRPSWSKKLGEAVSVPAMQTLDEIYGLQELTFHTKPKLIKATVFHIDSEQVLDRGDLDFVEAKVTEVHPRWIKAAKTCQGQQLAVPEIYDGDVVIVCAGYWCDKLMEVPGLSGMQGISWRWQGTGENNVISPWAPYKQCVVFQEKPGWMWGGDGSKIKPENWKPTRPQEAFDRVVKAYGKPIDVATHMKMGIRPFTKVKPCLLEEREPGLWLATGGAKNGCVASGWATWRLQQELS